MNIDYTLVQLIKAGNYPKFIAYLYQLYELQKTAYAQGVYLFNPDIFIRSYVLEAAAESRDIRFLEALCATQGNHVVADNIKLHAIVPAAKSQNFTILAKMMEHLLATSSYSSLTHDQNADLQARMALNRARFNIRATSTQSDNECSAHLTISLNSNPAVLQEFIQDIIQLRCKNPFTFVQWQHFVELVAKLDGKYANFIDLDAIKKYDYTNSEKIITAIQYAATDVVNTLQKITTTDPDLWEDCIWYFKTPNATADANRYFKVAAFLGKQDARFALYMEDPFRIPNLTNAGHLDSEKLKSLFRLKCAEIMAASPITTKPAPNFKAYAVGETLENQWSIMWSNLDSWEGNWAAGWIEAKWIKQLLHLLIALNKANISLPLDPNKCCLTKAPLRIAVEQQRTDIVELMLQLPQVDHIRKTQDGYFPLHLAAKNTAMTRLFLAHPKRDEFLQVTSLDNRNALFYAVEADNPETVELFITAGINVDCSHNGFWTALMYAIILNKIAVIPTLIANLFAKNPEIKLDIPSLLRVFYQPNIAGTTISLFVEHLIFANEHKNDPSALLLNYKNLKVGSANLLKLWESFKFDVNAVASDGLTILQRACIHGYTAVVVDLLKIEGIEINLVTGAQKYSALHYALQHNQDAIALLLLDDPKIKFNYEVPFLPLIDFTKQAAILEKLISQQQFDVNSKVNDTESFLSALLYRNKPGLYALAEKVLQQRPSADVDLVIGRGQSPLSRVISLLSGVDNILLSKLFMLMIAKTTDDLFSYPNLFYHVARRNNVVVLDALLALPRVIHNIGPMIPKLICQMTTESSNPARDLLIERLLAAKTNEPKPKATMKNLVDAFTLYINADIQELQGTMLHQACFANDSRFVDELLAAGADVNCVSTTVKKSVLYYTLGLRQRDAITLRLLADNNLKLNPDEFYLEAIDFATQRTVLEKLMAHPQFDVNSNTGTFTDSFLAKLIQLKIYDLAEKIIHRGDIKVDLVIGHGKSALREVELSLGDIPNPPVSKLFALMIPKSTVNFLADLTRFIKAANRRDGLVLDALLAIPAVLENIGPKIPELLGLLTIYTANPARDFLIARLLSAKNKKAKASMKNLVDAFQFNVDTTLPSLNGTMLHQACWAGDLSFFNDLMTLRVDVNCLNLGNETALKVALTERHYSIALRLLDENNLEIHLGRSILNSIDYRNQGEFFQKLIAHPKFNVNCVYDNDSGCLLAGLIRYGYYEAAEKLLERPGIDVDLKIDQALSAIERAAQAWEAWSMSNNYNNHSPLSQVFALMLPLSRVKLDRTDYLATAAEKDDQIVITALMKLPETIPYTSVLQRALDRNHHGSIALLKRAMIRNYGELMKKLLEYKFVCSAGFGWDGLLNHVVLCNGFHTPKIESAAIKLANLLYVLEWPNVLNPNPETLLRKIIEEDPNMIYEFIEPIKTKQYPNPFSKSETLLRFAALLEKVIGQRVEFPVEKPVVPVAAESVAAVVVGPIATPVAIEPSAPKLSSIGSFFKSLTASSATASAPELSEAQKAALLTQKAAIIERNNKIQAELEEAETKREAMEKEIQRKVQQDVSDHLMLADLTTDDLKALVSLYDTRKGIPDSEIIAREQLHAKAMDLGEKTGTQLARFTLCPELLFDKPQTPITLRLAMEYLLPCIKKELQRLPEPRPVNVPLTPAQLLALQAARVRGYLPQKTIAVGPQSENDDDDNAKAAMNSGL